jgi:hypothetical protein
MFFATKRLLCKKYLKPNVLKNGLKFHVLAMKKKCILFLILPIEDGEDCE